MSERSVEHATFVIERTYDASPSRVFAAWADRAAKASWLDADDEFADDVYEVTPTVAFGLPVGEGLIPTRWRFREPATSG
jgi:uncharacterized protein YndB with AHSA1/START domain